MVQFGALLADEHPDLPLFLIAHSMGSFAAQSVILNTSAVRGSGAGVDRLDVLCREHGDVRGSAGLEAFKRGSSTAPDMNG